VGSYGGFDKYLAMLHQLVADLGATDVYFPGHVSDAELTAYYEVADLFLCASEHEGFCVPLVEAFHMEVPVLAYAATAVPATMDGGGVLFDSTDPMRVAQLMDAILSDQDLLDSILDGQTAALHRLRARDFSGTLLGFVERVLRSPRRSRHEVAWDFWDQLKVAEALEELRESRPAIYRGLPEAAGEETRSLKAEG
jgi:glycosyltransferase involved in cell wall biosynthesis